MAIALLGSSVVHNTAETNYTSITGATPSGAAAGKLLIAVLSRGGESADTCSAPAGWTQVINSFSAAAPWQPKLAIFYKVAVGSDSLVFTLGNTDSHGTIVVSAWDGFNAASPISIIGATDTAYTTDGILPSVTTTSSNSVVISALAMRGNYNANGNGYAPSGFTSIFKGYAANISYSITTGVSYKAFAPAGATGTVLWDEISDASKPWYGLNFVINPAAGTVSAIDDPIVEGTSFNYTQSGMGTLSTITTDKTGVTVSSVTASSALLSGWTEGGLYPELPSAVQFEFTGDTGSALVSSNIAVPSGYTKLTVASPLFIANTLAQAILDETGRTIATSDVFYYDPYDDLVITSDTDYTVSSDGTLDLWLRVAAGADAGKMYNYTVTITESGAVVVTGGGLTSSGLTSSGLTSSGLTSSGL